MDSNHAEPEVQLFSAYMRDGKHIAPIDQGSGCAVCMMSIRRVGETNARINGAKFKARAIGQ